MGHTHRRAQPLAPGAWCRVKRTGGRCLGVRRGSRKQHERKQGVGRWEAPALFALLLGFIPTSLLFHVSVLHPTSTQFHLLSCEVGGSWLHQGTRPTGLGVGGQPSQEQLGAPPPRLSLCCPELGLDKSSLLKEEEWEEGMVRSKREAKGAHVGICPPPPGTDSLGGAEKM